MIERDILFLLAPGFEDNNRREYCPECSELWGVLSYFPAIKEALEIRYEPIAHPRLGLTALLGEGEWNCPTLVLAEGVDAGPYTDVKTETAIALSTMRAISVATSPTFMERRFRAATDC